MNDTSVESKVGLTSEKSNKYAVHISIVQNELALKKVQELRETVDGDLAELVDSLATILLLRQNIQYPMLGAKVTLHLPPEGEWVECSKSEHDKLPTWRQRTSGTISGDPVYKKLQPSEDQDITEHGTVTRRALVFDAGVREAPDGTYWDPNKKEYKQPDDYPMGTVNVIIPDDENRQYGEDYTMDVNVYTSIVPAESEPTSHSYTPGW